MIEEIKVLAEVISKLGEHSKDAFILWVIMRFGQTLIEYSVLIFLIFTAAKTIRMIFMDKSFEDGVMREMGYLPSSNGYMKIDEARAIERIRRWIERDKM